MSSVADLDAAAVAVYGVVPGEFVATRTRCAAEHPAFADEIRTWRKPAAAAWVLNVLSSRSELSEALALADDVRRASAALDGAALTRLGAQRRSIVSTLVTLAITTAGAEGVALSRVAQDDVAATINAALADPAAAAAVLSGRLARTLEPAGFGDVDLVGALAGSPAERPDVVEGADVPDARAEERRRRAAEDAAAEAQRELSRVDGRLAVARDRAGRLRERADALRVEWTRADADAAAAAAEVLRIDEERRRAVVAVRDTVRAAVVAVGRPSS